MSSTHARRVSRGTLSFLRFSEVEINRPLHTLAGMENPVFDQYLDIGAIIFPDMDQFDFTGPFEVLSRIPNSTFHVLGKDKTPVRDARGLILTPEKTFLEAPLLDVLLVPGGVGQVALMEDETMLSFIRAQVAHATIVFSVCTGALTLGAAGLLRGIKSTTHWASFHVLEHFGAIPINRRVVIDGKFVSAAGVSSGIDGALRVASLLRGDRLAQEIQLYMQYAPEPPFDSGTPESASPEVLVAVQAVGRELAEKRVAIAKRLAAAWQNLPG
jgi:cyclohexyl-isocyanide hydratase